jgi:hypothetical protein
MPYAEHLYAHLEIGTRNTSDWLTLCLVYIFVPLGAGFQAEGCVSAEELIRVAIVTLTIFLRLLGNAIGLHYFVDL